MPCDGLSSLLSFGRLEVRVRMWKRNVRMHVRWYTKGETISDGRQWRFKWRPQWYQLHAGIEFNWIEGTARGPLLYLLRLMFCNHHDFGSFHMCRSRRSSNPAPQQQLASNYEASLPYAFRVIKEPTFSYFRIIVPTQRWRASNTREIWWSALDLEISQSKTRISTS